MPCLATFLLLVSAICSSSWSFAVQARILAECTFGKIANEVGGQKMATTFSAKLAPYQNLSHSCVVKASEPNHFLRVKAKSNTQSRGFLHLSVFGIDGEEESHLLGHLDVLKSQSDWSSLTLCPSRFNNTIQDRKLTFLGSASLNFTIQIEISPGKIELNHPIPFDIDPGTPNVVFQFIPPQDISKTQLDVTVTSESDVPAYLKVSHICKDVTENIRLVDYKGESIRLSFAKKGRITLSKVSVPPLTDSTKSWFIGIALKNDSGKTAPYARKTLTLTLARSFDYSYAHPMSVLVISTILSGVLVSAIAFIFFKDLFYVQDVTCRVCCRGFCDHLSLCWEVFKDHWFTRGPKTYSYLTGIVGFVLMIGASQFVIANWYVMINEGNRDNCYYNDFCYRVSPWRDIPYNLMMSNLVYMLHGIILAACVCCMEANMLHQCRSLHHPSEKAAHDLKGKISFSIGYGFAWALIFEGCFSLIYHLCPSKMTFQFDTAFMFVIAGLSVILLHNGIKENTFCAEDAKGPVGAANAFLFFLVPLLVFNYFGAVHHFEMHHSEKGMSNAWKIPFLVFLGLWWGVIVLWACYKLFPVISGERNALCKWLLSAFVAITVVIVPIAVFIRWKENLPQALLYSCIFVSILAILGRACHTWYKKRADCWIDFFRFLYAVGVLVLWGVAMYYFRENPTTDKAESPEISRDNNQECEWLDFFDHHDMWHILSSHALLMGAYLLMFMSYKKPGAEGESRLRSYRVGPQEAT